MAKEIIFLQPVMAYGEIYIVMGIDDHEHDQVLAVCSSYDGAKRYCVDCLVNAPFHDVWIEKHQVTEC